MKSGMFDVYRDRSKCGINRLVQISFRNYSLRLFVIVCDRLNMVEDF